MIRLEHYQERGSMKFISNLFHPAGTVSSQKQILGSSFIILFFYYRRQIGHVLNVFGFSYSSIEKNKEYNLDI